MAVKLTRVELYHLVWKQPLTSLAKDYGISDVALRKICKKMKIPLPNAGHWMKVKFGKKPLRIKLPVDHKVKQEVTITPTSSDVLDVYSHLAERNKLEKRLEDEFPELLKVPEQLIRPDKLIREYKQYLSLRRQDNYNSQAKIPYPTYRDVISINVSNSLRPRALLFMDSFIKLLRHRGHSIVINNGETFVKIKEEEIKIHLKEKDKRVLKEDNKSSYPQYEFISTGTIYLKTGRWSRVREFNENKVPLEQQLAKILASLEHEAKMQSIETEKNKIRRAEYERQEELRKKEEERKRREIENFNSLLLHSRLFHEAKQIRSYVFELEQKAICENRLTEELIEWVAWARKKSEEYGAGLIQQ